MAVTRTVGTARHAIKGRPVSAGPDGHSLKIFGIGTAHLLGVRVLPEREIEAQAFLPQCCDGKRLQVELYPEKDAESHPLVIVYGPYDRGILNPSPDLTVNQQLIECGVAVPWELEIPEALWTHRTPAPAPEPPPNSARP